MLTREENDLLCRVEGDAPMGRLMRRYWLPVCLSAELEAGGAPKRVRLLGEDLVVFRDTNGTVGILDEYCPHRGASLVLARNEECALTCIYHGWRIAADGTVLDKPAEPEESDFRTRVKAIAYAARELGGLVWTYMGPPGLEPPLPEFGWTHLPAEQVCIIKVEQQSNWAQGLEGVIDSAHASYLHAGDIRPLEEASVPGGTSHYVKDSDAFLQRPSNDKRPRLEVQNTDYGFRYAAIRRPIREPEAYKYIRTTAFVAPCFAFFAPPPGWIYMQCWVPIDDARAMFYFVQADVTGPVDEAALRKRSGLVAGVDLDAQDRNVRTRANTWQQSRETMRRGSFSGIHGVQNQDMAVQESMGPLFDRTREHLGASDVAVIRFRRLMIESARSLPTGAIPLGLARTDYYPSVGAEEKIISLETPWQAVGAFAGEPIGSEPEAVAPTA